MHARLVVVDEVAKISRREFEREFVARAKPVVLRGFVADSSLSRWNLDYFAARAGAAEVPLYVRNEPGERSRVVGRTTAAAYARGLASDPASHARTSIGCLLGEVVPALAREVPPCALFSPRQHLADELFSGLDYFTQLHCHPKAHALLCHLEGEKEVVLHPPDDTPLLATNPLYAEEFTTSGVDFRAPVDPRFPQYAKATRLVAKLSPGDALFIPVGFWHGVSGRGLTTSLSHFFRARYRDHASLRSAVRNEVGHALEHLAPRVEGWIELGRTLLRERGNFVRVSEPILFRRAPERGEVDALAWASQQPGDIYAHLSTLHMLSVEIGAKTIVELGTRSGMSTLALASAARETGGRVHSFDVDACSLAHENLRAFGLEEHWSFHQEDDLAATWSAPIDHLFIDTTHTYEQTRAELAKWEPFVRSGGIVTLHDSFAFVAVDAAVRAHTAGRSDLRTYRHYHNNGLIVIFKG